MSHIGRIKVLKKKGESVLDWLVTCPHCGKQVVYGCMMTTSGIHNCYHCNAEVNRQIEFDKKTDYNVYVRKANNHEYEPYRYIDEKEKGE